MLKNSENEQQTVTNAFLEQADLCEKFGSSFTARILVNFLKIIDKKSILGRRVLDWSGDPDALNDALPLRVAAAFHALARSAKVPDLTNLYEATRSASDQKIQFALVQAIKVADNELANWLREAPQTNEVGRSSCLYLGLLQVAQRFNQPLRIFEIGSSGGLNLNLDKYSYTFGDCHFGKKSSGLHLKPAWAGESPKGNEPIIAYRRGCDIAPLDLQRKESRERLLAYLWPDQEDRIMRASEAIRIAELYPPVIDCESAASWVKRHVSLSSEPGVTSVLMHSITWGYFPKEQQAEIIEHMERTGQAATKKRPLAWVWFELEEGVRPTLRAQFWPRGEIELLAEAHTHCTSIEWKK